MNFEDRYGFLDRLLHRIAFRAGIAQRAMADVEETLYRERLAAIPVDAPVFITALPRSGTTILLRVLAASGQFATHTYRDMPFVLCPMLWSRFSRAFGVDAEPRERAHGDGLEVSVDSPEAFEEMIWKHFWPDHYRTDRIVPWSSSDENREFADFLEAHMRKIVLLRRDGSSDALRYASKNNLNIARLAARPDPLGDGIFVVPFRGPVQQAASMLRQHRRFLEIHRRDDFVREYMEAIGHHEFGRGLRPVDFGGWLEEASPPDRLEFWVRYWVAAYRFVLEHAEGSTCIVSYARLTAEPRRALADLASALGLREEDLARHAGRLRPPRTHEVGAEDVPAAVLGEAREIQHTLEARAVV